MHARRAHWKRSLRSVQLALGPFFIMLVFYAIGASANEPIFSRFLATLTSSLFLIGLLSSITWLIYTVGSEPAGSIVDRIGVRNAVLFGGALDAAGYLLVYFAFSIPVLVAVLIIEGVGSALFWSASRAYTVKRGKKNTGTALGGYTASWGIGWSFGPLIGGLLALTLNLRPVFLIGAVLMLVAVVAFSRVLPEEAHRPLARTLKYEARGGFIRDGINFLRGAPAGTKRIFVVQSLLYGALEIVLIFSPLYFLQLNDAEIGAAFFIESILFAVACIAAGTLSDGANKPLYLVLGFLGGGAIMLLLTVSSSLATVLLLMGLLGVALAFVEPISDAILYEIIEAKARGIATGLSQAAYGVGAGVGPIIAGAVVTVFGLGSSFTLAMLLCALGVLIGISLMRRA